MLRDCGLSGKRLRRGGCGEVRIARSIQHALPAPIWYAGVCAYPFASDVLISIPNQSLSPSPADDGQDHSLAEPLLKPPGPRVLRRELSSQPRCFGGRTVGVPRSYLLTIGDRFDTARCTRPGLTDEARLSPHADCSCAICSTLRVLPRPIDQGGHAISTRNARTLISQNDSLDETHSRRTNAIGDCCCKNLRLGDRAFSVLAG